MKKQFSVPKLIKYDDLSKSWYVYFRFYNNEFPAGKIFKFCKDINQNFKTYRQRQIAGEALAAALHENLKRGWNPFVPDLTHEFEGMTFYQALEFAMEKKKDNLAIGTYRDYMGTIRFVKTAISDLGLNYLEISEAKRAHIKTILEHIKKKRAWSNFAYNKNLSYLQAALSELIQWDIIPYSPAHKIKPLQVGETRANIPPTESEMKSIKANVSLKDPNFWFYVSLLYCTGIRPVEITRIKMSMIDPLNRCIILPADCTKNKRERIVPIIDFVWSQLSDVLSTHYSKDWYLFGSARPSGEGNRGKHKDFLPGPTMLKRDTATKRWHKLVKEDLGIDKNLYAMKKAGANAMIKAGMSRWALKELFGHTSELTTEIYITNQNEMLRKEVNQADIRL